MSTMASSAGGLSSRVNVYMVLDVPFVHRPQRAETGRKAWAAECQRVCFMPLYHTTIFSEDYPGTAFQASGAAWRFEKPSGVFHGTREELYAENERIRLERGHAPTQNYFGPGHPVFFDMEIMIRAANEQRPRQGCNLLCAAIDILHGCVVGYMNPAEDIHIRLFGTKKEQRSFFSTSGITAACRFAALASRASQSYAMHKLAFSYRSAGGMDMHPRYSQREFGVQRDPISHVRIASAITLAYSAIEEMQLEVRANRENPARLKDGSWNPVVRNELERRLLKAKIDIKDPFIWTLRGGKSPRRPRLRAEMNHRRIDDSESRFAAYVDGLASVIGHKDRDPRALPAFAFARRIATRSSMNVARRNDC
jgi:hypothetical protein